MSKTILITGAGSGFGKAAGIGMARNGHSIIATTQVSSQVTPLREEAAALGLKNFRVERLDLPQHLRLGQLAAIGAELGRQRRIQRHPEQAGEDHHHHQRPRQRVDVPAEREAGVKRPDDDQRQP